MGQVIGAGGSNIHEMQEKSGCRIAFIKATELDESAPPGKQLARIKGPPEKVMLGEQVLLEKLEEVKQVRINKVILAS